MKFKVGDKVRNASGYKVGEIIGVDDSRVPYHVLYDNGASWWYFEDDLVLVEEKAPITQFSTGAVRDNDDDKAKMDLLPWDLMFRLAKWYELGAKKYGRNNWRLGQKKSHTFSSLIRHVIKYKLGQTDEDHLAAVIWNAFSLMNVDEYLSENEDLNDL